jgi:hypothetical protein
VPAVLVATEAFDTLTQAALEFANYGDVPRVLLPRDLDNTSDEEVVGLAEAYADEIIRSLLRGEQSPVPAWNPYDDLGQTD